MWPGTMTDRVHRFGVVSLAAFLGFGLLAGCSSRSPSARATSAPTARTTALAWFTAIDRHNLHATLAAFAPGVSERAAWSAWPPSEWSIFSHVRCKDEPSTYSNRQTGGTVVVPMHFQ